MRARDARVLALRALDDVGLGSEARRFPDQLSGGQQQRVAIARALVGDRRLVLADEPTGALDSVTGEAVLELLRARVDAGAGGVLVTHEARHAGWADRVVFLRDGLLVDEARAPERLRSTRVTGHRSLGSGWGPARCASPAASCCAPRGATLLVLLMVLLPLTAVVGLDTLLRTGEVSVARAAPARARRRAGARRRRSLTAAPSCRTRRRPTVAQRRAADRRGWARTTCGPCCRARACSRSARTGGERPVRTPDGRTARAVLVGADLPTPPCAALPGAPRPRPGRRRRGRGHPASSCASASRSAARCALPDGDRPHGRPASSTLRTSRRARRRRPPAALGLAGAQPARWYAGGPAVTWEQVHALNALRRRRAVPLGRARPAARRPVPRGLPGTATAPRAARPRARRRHRRARGGAARRPGLRRRRAPPAPGARAAWPPAAPSRGTCAGSCSRRGCCRRRRGRPRGRARRRRRGASPAGRSPRCAGASWGPFEVSVRDVVLLSACSAPAPPCWPRSSPRCSPPGSPSSPPCRAGGRCPAAPGG